MSLKARIAAWAKTTAARKRDVVRRTKQLAHARARMVASRNKPEHHADVLSAQAAKERLAASTKALAVAEAAVAKLRRQAAPTISATALRAVVPTLSPERAKQLAPDLAAAMRRHHITTGNRAAMFIAQTAHESGGFIYREEIWGPTAAQRGYEGRRDLGNTHAGDGSRFRGRSYIQITGRANYTAISKATGIDFVSHPTRLAEPRYAAEGAAWWWEVHGLNSLADGGPGNFVAVTRRINGGTNGLAERQAYYNRARQVAGALIPR